MFAHPGERDIREPRFRFRIRPADVGVVARKPKLDNAIKTRRGRVRPRFGAAPADPGEVLTRFIDRIRRSRKPNVLAEEAVEVLSRPFRNVRTRRVSLVGKS